MFMQLKNSMKKLFIFLSLFLIFIFGLFIYIVFYTKGGPKKEPALETPFPASSLQNRSLPNPPWSADSKEKARRSYLVGKLINILPYGTTLFTLSYDIDKDLFALSLKKDSVEDANKSFDLFLKENGIESRTWIENLTVLYK